MNLKRCLDSHLEDNGLWSCYIAFGGFFCYRKNSNTAWLINERRLTPRVNNGILYGGSNFWVCKLIKYTVVTIEMNFFQQYFILVRFVPFTTEWRFGILVELTSATSGSERFTSTHYSFSMLIRRRNIVQRRTPFTQCLYSFRLHESPNCRLLRNTIAPM